MKAPITFLFAFIFPPLLAAQVQQPIWFHHIDAQDGLPSNRVLDVFMDSKGLVWTASVEGLSRFDGHQIQKYPADPSDSTALSEDFITGHFFEDKQSNIWFCTEKTIHCYNRKKDNFSRYILHSEQGLDVKNNYFAIALEQDSFLWLRAGENKSLYWFNIHTGQNSPALGQIDFKINCFAGIHESGRLAYIFVVNEGIGPGVEIFHINNAREVVLHEKKFDGHSKELPALPISTVHFDGKQQVWLGAKGQLIFWDIFSNHYILYPTGRDNLVKVFSVENDRLLICESKKGLLEFRPKKGFGFLPGRLIEKPDAEVNSQFTRPYQSPDGTIWLSLKDEMLLFGQLGYNKFQSIPKEPISQGGYAYRGMLQDSQERVWISTYSDGLLQYDASGNLIHPFHPRFTGKYHLPDNQINHIALDNRKNLWVAATKGLMVSKLAEEPFEMVASPKGTEMMNITHLCHLQNGQILASTFRNGIFGIKKSDDSWQARQIITPEKNKAEAYSSLFQDSKGSVYASYNDEKLKIYTLQEEQLQLQKSIPISGMVHGFIEDREKQLLWIATSNGLLRLGINELNVPPSIFKCKEGANIQSMARDKQGNLWLGTTHGLQCFFPEKELFRVFTLTEGMQSILFDKLACMMHQDSSLWFGGNAGITIVNPDLIQEDTFQACIYLTDLMINDKRPEADWLHKTDTPNISLRKKYTFSYQENTLSFHFAALDFRNPNGAHLSYFLEGEDHDWVHLSQTGPGLARYANLKAGHYTFRVRSNPAKAIGQSLSHELAITIQITPPFWQRLWFIVLIGILLALIIYSLLRYRINLIREKAEFKTRIAENKLTALRAQMNPHFIFNSLNSINNFILGNNAEFASQYLSKFAGLIRMIFDLSQHASISLEEELEMLKLYLEVESMRFREPFQYSINLADDIDSFEIQIPTMILQPFVENAIKHGISHKEKGKGEIQINIFSNEKFMVCVIQDNGVGRKKSAEINQQKGRKHNSRGIDITRERLQTLQNQGQLAYQIKIEDLKNEQGQASGTRVEILFPQAPS